MSCSRDIFVAVCSRPAHAGSCVCSWVESCRPKEASREGFAGGLPGKASREALPGRPPGRASREGFPGRLPGRPSQGGRASWEGFAGMLVGRPSQGGLPGELRFAGGLPGKASWGDATSQGGIPRGPPGRASREGFTGGLPKGRAASTDGVFQLVHRRKVVGTEYCHDFEHDVIDFLEVHVASVS